METCVICGGKLDHHRRYTFVTSGFRTIYRGHEVFRCAGDGLSQVAMDLVDEARLAAYYAGEYRVGAKIAVLGEASGAIYRQRGAGLLALAELHIKHAPTRVFEFGAGYGFNLLAFLDRHPAARATTDEVSIVATQNYEGRIQPGRIDDGPHDAIIFSHVLEHVTDPVGLLRKAGEALAAGGVIVIEVPNDIDAILRYNGPDEPHLTFFELDTLRTTLETAGMDVLDLYACGPSNVRDTFANRWKRRLRNALMATAWGDALLQRRAARKVAGDSDFNRRNPDGMFLRAAVRPRSPALD